MDAQNRPYLGRILELSLELPYQLSAFPQALALSCAVPGYARLTWTTRYPFLAVTMPATALKSGAVVQPMDLKVVEGMNCAGLTFSLQSFPQASGPEPAADATHAALSAVDLGAWVLGQFATVGEVKAALAEQTIVLEPVQVLGGLKMPFHYSVHDAHGDGIVIEFHQGQRTVYDNPVGVMTNLGNYTFLSNVYQSKGSFGTYQARQPGSGSAKAGLPASDTSVDRFVQVAYYAQFAEKQTDPDRAVQMVAHIMNNFDRPRGATVDYPNQGSSHLQVQGFESGTVASEFTSWTSLSDMDRKLFYVRDSAGMNFARFDVMALSQATSFRSAALAQLLPKPHDITASLC